MDSAPLPDDPSWLPGGQNYRIRAGTMFALYAVYTVFVLGTLGLFLIQSRNKHSGLSKRSVKLVTLQSVGGFVVGTVGLLSTALKYWACFLKLWLFSLGMILLMSAMSARAIQLIVVSRVHMLNGQLVRNDPQFVNNVQRSLTRKHTLGEKKHNNAPADSSPIKVGALVVDKAVFEEAIKESRLEMDTKDRAKVSQKLEWYMRLQPYVTDRSMVIYIICALAFTSVLTLVVNVTNKEYSLSPMSVTCNLSWGFIPMNVIIIIYLLLVCPAFLSMTWGVKDAFGIKTDLIISDIMGIINTFVMMVWELKLHALRQKWSGLFFVWNAVFLIHISSVAVPLWRSTRHSRNVSRRLKQENMSGSMATLVHTPISTYGEKEAAVETDKRDRRYTKRSDGFVRVLDDPNLYAAFREFASSCFCSEMIAFIDEYQSLKSLTLLALGQQEYSAKPMLRPATSSTRSPVAPTFMVPGNEVGGALNGDRMTVNINLAKLNSNATVSILKASQAVYPHRGFTQTTPFPPALMDMLVSIFSTYINSTSFTAVSVPPIMVRRIQDRLNNSELYLTILDEVKEEVLYMLDWRLPVVSGSSDGGLAPYDPNWAPGTRNYLIRVSVNFTLYALYSVFVLVTLGMFLIQSRNKHSELSRRSVRLVTLQALGGFILGTVSLVNTALKNWACFAKLWMYSLSVVLLMSAISARAIQLIVVSKIHSLSGQLERNDPQFMKKVQRSITRRYTTKGLHPQVPGELEGEVYVDRAVLEEAILESKAVVDTGRRMKILGQIQKYTRLRPYVTDRAMTIYICFALGITSILTLAINVVGKEYSISPLSIHCEYVWGFVPITGFIFFYLFAVCPALLAMTWGLKDAYGIKTDLIICDTVGVISTILMLVWQFGVHELTIRWSGLFFIWDAVFLIHISSVAVPLWRSTRHSQSVSDRLKRESLSASMVTLVQAQEGFSNTVPAVSGEQRSREFSKVLDDANKYAYFRDFAATCFCSEMTAFIDEYQSLKAMTLLALGQQEYSTEGRESWETDVTANEMDSSLERSRSSMDGYGMAGDFLVPGSSELESGAVGGRVTANINLRKLQTNATVGILQAAQEVYPHRRFTDTTPFPPAMMDKLVTIFSNYINSTSYTAVSVPPIMVRRIQSKLNTNQMYLTILDEVKEHVLRTLYTEVFTRRRRSNASQNTDKAELNCFQPKEPSGGLPPRTRSFLLAQPEGSSKSAARPTLPCLARQARQAGAEAKP
ncbi:hypothetical protein GQ54DRAFT_339511 [Martensiomyces pterosporus]|nr:hypothetical protein GQ54DRAFT_339511 [Martensiomyces pterosporus]